MSEMNQDRFDELKEAYALNALSEEERREVEGYLTLHPELKSEMEELHALAQVLALSPAEKEPSPELRRNLMRTIEPESSSQTETEDSSFIQRFQEYFSFGRLALGVATLALVVLLGWNVMLQGEVRDLQAEVEDRQTYAMQGSGAASSTEARIIRLDQQQSIIFANDMPSIPENRTFQIWIIENGTPRSAGTFAPGDTVAAPITDSLGGDKTVAITIEPAGGSDQPTSEPVLQTNLQT